jgi:hypothetical protein
MPVVLKNPDAPATSRQLYKIRQLTGEDLSGDALTMQDASDLISEFEVDDVIHTPVISSTEPFNEAQVTLIEGDQGSGKSNTAVAIVVDAYYNDCAKIYLESRGIYGEVKGYDRKNRIIKVQVGKDLKYYQVPQSYKMKSPMKIFANFHLYGIPFVYIPTFGHLLKWLKMGIIVDGWLLIDEYYIGGSARDSMTAFGKELNKQSFQMRKMQLKVVILTPIAKLIEQYARIIPTKHILCAYDKRRKEITLTVREKGVKGSKTLPPYDATQYWVNYWTNERINN